MPTKLASKLSPKMSETAEVSMAAVPVEVHFHDLERSDALVAKVEAKVAKLKRHFDRMSACRVVLEAAHRGPEKPRVYLVKVEVSIPGRKPLVVQHQRTGAHASEDLPLAIRDAFEVATRKVDEISSKLAGRVKQERGRRRPHLNGADEPVA